MNQPETCTIEMTHGGTIHVAHTPLEVRAKITAARTDRMGDGFICVNRQTGDPDIERGSRWAREIQLDADEIAGIYPLTQASSPAKRR